MDGQLEAEYPSPRGGVARKIAFHGVGWLVLLPLFVLGALYVTLLITPIKLPFVAERARDMAVQAAGDGLEITLGDTYLALETGVPVLRFAPVNVRDPENNGEVQLEALELGFSPINALRGQPGMVVNLIRPQLQLVQDLLGPRLAEYEIAESGDGERPLLTVQGGSLQLPTVGITAGGLDVRDTSAEIPTVEFRSDHDWMIYNLMASEAGLRDVLENARSGLFSRLVVKDAQVDVFDAVYGLARTFADLNVHMNTDISRDLVQGEFSFEIGGAKADGMIELSVLDEGKSELRMDIENVNFSAIAPFMDDPDSMTAFRGAGDMTSVVHFDTLGEERILRGGQLGVDLAGMQLRLQDDHYPIHEAKFDAEWDAGTATLKVEEGLVRVANSSAILSSTVVMGLDPIFGPTVRISSHARDIVIHPHDMDAPAQAYDEAIFKGWNAPLYAALGIEDLRLTRGDMRMDVKGRADMLASGPGFDLRIATVGATADDLKRLWPYVMGTPAREWFVEHVHDGVVDEGRFHINFAPGTVPEEDEIWVWPENSFKVDMAAQDVLFSPVNSIDPILVTGQTVLQMRDADLRIAFGEASIDGGDGPINLQNAGLRWVPDALTERSEFAFSGNLQSQVPALLAFAQKQVPDQLDSLDLPIALDSLSGSVDTNIQAEFVLQGEENELIDTQYLVTGKLADFSSTEKIMDRSISDGQFEFSVGADGYEVKGPTSIDGLVANLELSGDLEPESTPKVSFSANVNADDLKQFGFDVSDFLSGSVQFEGAPIEDGLEVSINLKDAEVRVDDIGLRKAKGVAGSLSGKVLFDGDRTDISNIQLAFADVDVAGEVVFDQEEGLKSADFSRFRLSPGDDASLKVTPNPDGYKLTLRGKQLDLKPLLSRLFSLDSGTGGPTANAIAQRVEIDGQIDTALGFYSTSAFNVAVDLSLTGANLHRVNMQANFGSGNAISVTTNPTQGGKVMTVAFQGLGQVLRFTGTYPQIAGGTGSFVARTDNAQNIDTGEIKIENFAILNEDNVAQVLGNHQDSRQLIARGNRIDIESGEARFVRRHDRIELNDVVIDGGTIGGTARGFIYTELGQYDITGTYIPLFGLNNAFQKIPILGRILGGRDGEGLLGVTFAVRGPLSQPEFRVNPASILLPGAFRSLSEFRARDLPDSE